MITIPCLLNPPKCFIYLFNIFFCFDAEHPCWCDSQPTFTYQTLLPLSFPCVLYKTLKLHSDVWFQPALTNSTPAPRLHVNIQSERQITGVKPLMLPTLRNVNKCLPISLPLALTVSLSFISKLINSDAFLWWSFMTAYISVWFNVRG